MAEAETENRNTGAGGTTGAAGRGGTTGTAGTAGTGPTVAEDFDGWLRRVTATHGAVLFTCTSRLRGDRAAIQRQRLAAIRGLVLQLVGGL